MTEDDKFHVFERISALYEARGKSIPSGRALALYWDALRGLELSAFDAAAAKANEMGTINSEHIRAIARDLKRDGLNQKAAGWLCHAHGDGQYEPGGIGRPEVPSCNPTVSWCERCRYYVGRGQQAADVHDRPNAKRLIGALAERKELTEWYP